MNTPLVSVAIISYNQEDVIEECIDSVLNQSYNNIEIIISDDASVDKTQEIIARYKMNYPGKFKINLSKTNLGITKNSNIANNLCEGEYIAWLGGDDIMLPSKITEQVKVMEANQSCSLCHHNLILFDSDSNEEIGYMHNKSSVKEGDIKTLIKHGTINGASATMVRRRCVPKKGFNELIPVASDWLYWIETVGGDGKVLYIDKLLGKYRRGHSSVTQNADKSAILSQNELDHLNTCNILLKYYPEYLSEIRYSLARNLYSLRFKRNYLKYSIISLRINLKLNRLIFLFVFIITFGKVKL